MLWAYFYCYQLTIDSHQNSVPYKSTPEPVVVYNHKLNSVMQANQLALKEGIKVGYGLAQTAALCPHIRILEFSLSAEKQTLISLAHRLYPLASDIVIDTHNGMALRLDNLEQYYGDLNTLWNVITDEIESSGIHYHFGTAWGIEAARLLAKNKTNQCSFSKKNIAELLAHCPLSKTELDSKTIASLAKVGIKTTNQLLCMPVHELGRRFSNETIRYLSALKGETFPQQRLFRPAKIFKQTEVLPFDIENTQHLLPYIKIQLQALEQYLRTRNLLSSALLFSINFRQSSELNIKVNAATPLSTLTSWLSLVSLKLESILLPEPAVSITLTCNRFEPLEEQTNDFFSHRTSTLAQKQLIGKLRAKLGDTSTVHPRAGDSNIFEYMSVCHTQQHTTPYQSDVVPAFLFATPKPLVVPTRICFGPIRLHTGWWLTNTLKRDYFIAETEQGARLLICKDNKAKWWIQGLYS